MSGDIVRRADDEARSLRFVAEHNRKVGETKYTVRRLEQLADTLEQAAMSVTFYRDALRAEIEAHQVTKIRLAEAIAENQRLQAVQRNP
jgi:uncharacterized protein YqiB (DUF1249 family)